MYYIGLMSGTSMDAVDAALVEFRRGRVVSLRYRQYPIVQRLRNEVRRLDGDSPLHEVAELDARLGRLFAQAVKAILRSARIDSRHVRAIGSHGQTILHRPDAAHPQSLQIGDPNVIARETGISTVADFRRMDLAAGGQGAPLAPAFHAAQFRLPSKYRCVLNIGGIANLTILPPVRSRQPVRGFDTGPGNGLMDDWSRTHLHSEFDRDGRWAARGRVDAGILTAMLRDGYFRRKPPKSTGRDHFNPDWLKRILRHGKRIPASDVQATLLELTATSIARSLRREAPRCTELLVCGGGLHNLRLMDRLRAQLEGIAIRSTGDFGVDPDSVEAVTFAWLAKKRLDGAPGNLPSVTGARSPVLLGAVYEPAEPRK